MEGEERLNGCTCRGVGIAWVHHGADGRTTDLEGRRCRAVRAREEHAGLPCFLFGESMGGAICLLIHLCTRLDEWAGVVLVAPMCRISDRIRPPWSLSEILTFVLRAPTCRPRIARSDLLRLGAARKQVGLLGFGWRASHGVERAPSM
jgi:alpha-beta hydrolase superfamily lysophospholipase